MNRDVEIFELMPDASGEASRISDEQLGDYMAARLAFEQGRWTEARSYLARLPDGDGPRQFLLEVMDRLESPPKDWKGVIALDSK
jgi:hypothetical protein